MMKTKTRMMKKRCKWLAIFLFFLFLPLTMFKLAVMFIEPVVKAIEEYQDMDWMDE